ncbi:Pleckstrin homology domain-containing protein [Choanephora cucurbitarum]|nr:Pleckstrin homology domain-containing protein [Choanephora cucurbitarum]
MKHDTQPIYQAKTMPSIRTEALKRDQAKSCPNIKLAYNTTIPIIETPLAQAKDQIIREGQMLCIQTKQWYTKRHQELHLRKKRLRWRQFKAVLWPDRLELYHISKVIVNLQRLAHVIYFDTKGSHHKVKLSMVSTRDFVWSLEYLHCDNKSLVAFHFQSTHLSEAQAWYMAIYHTLPANCKKPIPSYIDIQVIMDHTPPFPIRLPLDHLRYCYDQQHHVAFDVRLEDVRLAMCSLLKRRDNTDWQHKTFKLCWRHASIAALVQCDQLEQFIASGTRIEWIQEEASLVGPQLIEKSHLLELHVDTAQTQCPKKNITFDGLLTQRSNQKSKHIFYYVILYGHHLFFFDTIYHSRFKRQDQQTTPKEPDNPKHWFSATTGLLFQQRRLTISKQTQQQRTRFQLGSMESSPHFKPNKTEWMPPPDPDRLIHAKRVLDLHQVEAAQPLLDTTSFEIRLKEHDSTLYYEAPNTQIMLEWVTLINYAIKLDRLLLHSTVSLSHHHGSCHKNILLSGLLYVKQNFKASFKPYYCILCKNDNDQGILLFDIMKRAKSSLFCLKQPLTEKQAREERMVYEKKQILIDLENAYIYSGEECVLDQYVVDAGQEPLRYYKDGVVTGGDTTADCVFVVWQVAKRHVIPDFREYLSLLKLGHRLGNRGSCWVFKARSKQERDEWIWALHVEFGLSRPSNNKN